MLGGEFTEAIERAGWPVDFAHDLLREFVFAVAIRGKADIASRTDF